MVNLGVELGFRGFEGVLLGQGDAQDEMATLIRSSCWTVDVYSPLADIVIHYLHSAVFWGTGAQLS